MIGRLGHTSLFRPDHYNLCRKCQNLHMRLEPLPIKLSNLRWMMIRVVWRHSSWIERAFHIPEIWLTLHKRIHIGGVNIVGLWSEMSRFAPEGHRKEKFFLLFVEALPGGKALSELVAQRLLVEIDRRKGICAYGPNGSHFRLMEVCDVVAREFAGMLKFNLSK